MTKKCMRGKWLTLVLKLTNLIYHRKQSELGRHGLRDITNIFSLIGLEIILALVSLPLYLTTSEKKTVAFLEEKGEYTKISVDYNLRRVLTLTGVGVVFIVWTIKFLLIFLTPSVAGPLQLYTVSELEPVGMDNQELIFQDTGMQTAKVSKLLPIPKVEKIEKTKGNKYKFLGTGEPTSEVVIFLVGQQNLMYTEKVLADGTWQIEHSQEDFRLNDGIHSIFVFHYDEDAGIRSDTTSELFFRVKTPVLEKVVTSMDILANWSVIIIIIIGVLLTFLTL